MDVPTSSLPIRTAESPAADPSVVEVSPAPSLETLLKAQAYGLGFDLVGITHLGPVASAAAFEAWVAAGYAGEMGWLARGAEKRRDTRLAVPASLARTDARVPAVSAIVVAMDYGGREPGGPVARYARGQDYHAVLEERLRALHRWLEARLGRAVPGKPYVDTGPLLERDLARRAGLGWFGKNTNLIHPTRGSFHFLGALLVGIELAPDAPFEADRCGTCTRCLDACPTGAFVAPRVLDATRCVSYLTIELQGAIDEALRAGMGDRLYGCDVCQDVCPWNVRFARALPEDSPFQPREALAGRDARTLAREVLAMDVDAYRAAFKGSPMKRAKLPAMKRNAAVVLGNVGTVEDVDVLTRALDDEEPLVREHAAWALSQLGDHAPTTP
ncbi:MAG: Epoxyqueuosine reductase [uncultured Gemmatimonadaceae bacterium]|uniref:Epoxyqueuosine reductase n=1 Tax=uncultured Gemmatimonadaceae bacterium TaxID=246130 RepID=A0A6J4M2V1_9BACT|nr:MAG: Epoxyqueuosine reductase [uncultured Gemmatimonadaceae bacterium]